MKAPKAPARPLPTREDWEAYELAKAEIEATAHAQTAEEYAERLAQLVEEMGL